jgi:hypothetical protein
MWKSISKLTQVDLAETPVWELRVDSGSEFVRPTALVALNEYRDGPVYVAATRYVAASGDTYFGYCSPTDPSGLDYTQPVVLTPHGPFPLWRPDGLSREYVSTLASALSAVPRNLFPMQIECLVPVNGVRYTDSVDAA